MASAASRAARGMQMRSKSHPASWAKAGMPGRPAVAHLVQSSSDASRAGVACPACSGHQLGECFVAGAAQQAVERGPRWVKGAAPGFEVASQALATCHRRPGGQEGWGGATAGVLLLHPQEVDSLLLAAGGAAYGDVALQAARIRGLASDGAVACRWGGGEAGGA